MGAAMCCLGNRFGHNGRTVNKTLSQEQITGQAPAAKADPIAGSESKARDNKAGEAKDEAIYLRINKNEKENPRLWRLRFTATRLSPAIDTLTLKLTW